MEQNQRFFWMKAFLFFSLACFSQCVYGQKPVSQDIKLNEEAGKQIEAKMRNSFGKYPNPNPNEKLRGTNVTYLFIGNIFWRNGMGIYPQIVEVVNFGWTKTGNVVSPSPTELLNGIEREWEGKVLTYAEYNRQWKKDSNNWGLYQTSFSRCEISVSKMKGKDWEFSPLKCGDSFTNYYGASIISLTRNQIETLEKGEVDFDEFVDLVRIANGNANLQKAREIGDDLVRKVFRQCPDGKWYTNTMFPLSKSAKDRSYDAYKEVYLVHQFDGLNWKVKEFDSIGDTRIPDSEWEGRVLLTSKTYRSYQYLLTDKLGWSEMTKDDVLHDLRIYKTNKGWFASDQSLEENDLDLMRGGIWISFGKYEKGSAPIMPLKLTDCVIVDKILANGK